MPSIEGPTPRPTLRRDHRSEKPARSPRSGDALRAAIGREAIVPLIGIYDAFSASIAARYYDGIFVSGFGFAASHYGLPDIGFIAWSDMVAFVERVRTILPRHHILVDIDDGYADAEVACHVVSLLEKIGASGVVIEDQKRPRRCGHFDGKQILELDAFLEKLTKVLATRSDMVVIARTDASDPDEIRTRARAFDEAGADAVLVDGVRDLGLLRSLSARISKPLAFNQIAGGKSPPATLDTLRSAGVSVAIYSTPCLFAAQAAIEGALRDLKDRDGLLPAGEGVVDVKSCAARLQESLERRDRR